MQSLFLSIIIPTFQRKEALLKCLNKLDYTIQDLTNQDYEIIVTDDSRNDDSKLAITNDFPKVKWVKGPQKGPAANRNNGASLAVGNWFVFIDDDCLPEPELLKSYIKVISDDPELDALEGSIYPLGEFNPNNDDTCPINITGGVFWSANIAVKNTVFKEINGFDENYPLAALEDLDIYYRLKEKYKLKFVPEAKVLHPVVRIPLSKKIKNLPALTRSWVYHTNKHHSVLGYHHKYDVLFNSIKFYFIHTFVQLFKGNFKKMIYFGYQFFVGNAIILGMLLKQKNNKH